MEEELVAPIRIAIAEADVKNIDLPDGYEIVKKPDPRERILDEIARLETELAFMQPPTDEELIEVGRMYHPYYQIEEAIAIYKTDL